MRKIAQPLTVAFYHFTIQYNTIQYDTIQYNTIQYFIEHSPKGLFSDNVNINIQLKIC